MVLIISYSYIIASSDCTYLEQQTHICIVKCNVIKKDDLSNGVLNGLFLFVCFVVTNPGSRF